MTTEKIQDLSTEKTKVSSRGGARPGSGRPKGSKDRVSIRGLLDAIESNGQDYEEMLMEDFLKARQTDGQLAVKYHSLILNKIMPTLQHVEVDETASTESRQAAFLKALETIGGVIQETPPTDAE